MAETSIGIASAAVPTAPAASRAAAPAGSFLPRLLAGAVILLAWEFVVRAIAPAYVAKPSTVRAGDPARDRRSRVSQCARRNACRGRRRIGHYDRRRHRHRSTDGPQQYRRPHDPRLCQRLQRFADDHRIAAVLAVVRLFERSTHRHHYLCRDLRHHHERRRRRARRAARISGSLPIVPLRPSAHADRHRLAGVDALSAGRLPPRRRPRADRRGGGGILPLDRRARLLHPVQFALLSPQRGLRRRAAARRPSASASNCW